MAEGGEEIEMQDYDYDNDNVFDDMEQNIDSRESLQRQLLENKVDDFYESVGQTPDDMTNYDNFEFDKDGKTLFVKTDRGKVPITYKNNPRKFKAISTLKGGMRAEGVRNYLGINDDPQINPKAVASLQKFQSDLPDNVESIPLTDLPQVAGNVI